MTYNEIHAALRDISHVNGRKEEAVVAIVTTLNRPVSAGEVAEWVNGPLPWGRRRVVGRIRSPISGPGSPRCGSRWTEDTERWPAGGA